MGWFAGFALILSMWFIGEKNILGPIFGVIGNAIWIYIGIKRGRQYDLIFVATLMTLMSARAILMWIGWM